MEQRLSRCSCIALLAAFVFVHGCATPRDIFDAARTGNKAAVKHFLRSGTCINAKDDSGRTPLHIAARHGRLGVVQLLVSNGADKNVMGGDGIGTPMHEAATYGHTAVAAYLMSMGVDVDVRGAGGETPLHHAVICDSVETARFLVSHGADINAKTKAGWTPLWVAAENRDDSLAIWLLKRGAQVKGKDHEGDSVLHIAVCAGNDRLAKLVISRGIKPDVFAAAGMGDTRRVRELLPSRTRVNCRDGHGCTPLHWAAACGQLDTVRLLISMGASVNAKTTDGNTPLLLVLAGRRPIQSLIMPSRNRSSRKIAKLLITDGADVGIKDSMGLTAADYASSAGYNDIVSMIGSK